MKVLIMPSNLKQTKLDCDGVIIGINGLSVNLPCNFKIEDIKKIKKDVFICLNKNIHNKDIDYLKETLVKLNDYNIKGLIFYDLSVINYKSLLNYELIWGQEHMVNNFLTVNYMNELGIKNSYISNDITKDDMIEIKNNTTSKLFVTVFGYLPIFASYRHLVDNYIKTFNLSKKQDLTINKEGKVYPIIDNEDGTFVYSDFILNGLKESLELNYDYVVLNSFKIKNFKEILYLFKTVNKDNLEEYEKTLASFNLNLGKGFFDKGTVYKVK